MNNQNIYLQPLEDVLKRPSDSQQLKLAIVVHRAYKA